jgi:hypothetical protein
MFCRMADDKMQRYLNFENNIFLFNVIIKMVHSYEETSITHR